MLVHPHNYSDYREVCKVPKEFEVRVEETHEGHYIEHVSRIDESYGVFGNSPKRFTHFHHTTKIELLEFPTNTLGRIKAKEKAIKRLKTIGEYDPRIPVSVVVNARETRPLNI